MCGVGTKKLKDGILDSSQISQLIKDSTFTDFISEAEQKRGHRLFWLF